MAMPKKLDARRKENRLKIVIKHSGPGDWTAEAFGHMACAGTKSKAVKMLRGYFEEMRKVGIGPRTNRLLTEVHALRVAEGMDLEEAVDAIGPRRVKTILRRDYSKRVAASAAKSNPTILLVKDG
jgi:hypothetical protein